MAVAPTVDPHENGDRFRVNAAYINALEEAGLTPVVAQPVRDLSRAAAVLNIASGLVLTGGTDVNPELYGEMRHPNTDEASDLRDAWESALIGAARSSQIPTLAICRGMQMVNVHLGGSLIQDLPSEMPDGLRHNGNARKRRVHDVSINRNSRLAAIVPEEKISVNSLHHQGLKKIATGLCVSAQADDGVVEAVEWAGDDWWMIAVQWHPEELTRDDRPWDRNIFAAFASRTRGK